MTSTDIDRQLHEMLEVHNQRVSATAIEYRDGKLGEQELSEHQLANYTITVEKSKPY